MTFIQIEVVRGSLLAQVLVSFNALVNPRACMTTKDTQSIKPILYPGDCKTTANGCR